jgi:hypothetical protein
VGDFKSEWRAISFRNRGRFRAESALGKSPTSPHPRYAKAKQAYDHTRASPNPH